MQVEKVYANRYVRLPGELIGITMPFHGNDDSLVVVQKYKQNNCFECKVYIPESGETKMVDVEQLEYYEQ